MGYGLYLSLNIILAITSYLIYNPDDRITATARDEDTLFGPLCCLYSSSATIEVQSCESNHNWCIDNCRGNTVDLRRRRWGTALLFQGTKHQCQ